jgi:uncharacterized protein (TIGR02145 family)
MRKLVFLTILFCSITANGQNYLISFAGSGASTTVSSVKVENLTTGAILTLPGNDVLRLTLTTGVNTTKQSDSPAMTIYPNPTTDYSNVRIYPPAAGISRITIFENTGKQVAQAYSYLDNQLQQFRISGLKSGFYFISIRGSTFQYSGKLFCDGRSAGLIRIEKISNNQSLNEKPKKENTKGMLATVDMAYSTGNRLKFTGISGNYSTLILDIPTGDKAITFNYIGCTDGENNNYSVVKIGNQVWMAENLKTKKYSNGDFIGTTTPISLDISGESTPKYQWASDGNETTAGTYGRLYTWYAVMDSRNVCPTGWHVPSDVEWTTLENYLITNDYNYDGAITGNKIAKALASNALWAIDVGIGTIGNPDYPNKRNSSGFSALPGGERTPGGGFNNLGYIGNWWTATAEISGSYNRGLYWSSSDLKRPYIDKKYGYSIRCLKD